MMSNKIKTIVIPAIVGILAILIVGFSITQQVTAEGLPSKGGVSFYDGSTSSSSSETSETSGSSSSSGGLSSTTESSSAITSPDQKPKPGGVLPQTSEVGNKSMLLGWVLLGVTVALYNMRNKFFRKV